MTVPIEWLPADTAKDALLMQWSAFRKMSPNQRFALALSMSESLRRVVVSGVRSRYPEYDALRVRHEVNRLTLDPSLASLLTFPKTEQTKTQEEFLLQMAQSLERAAVPFMLSGSHASSFHGRPRATNDVDIVIDPTLAQLETFLTLLGENAYVSAESAREAIRQRFRFNVVDVVGGWKADLIVRKDRPFSLQEFRRRRVGSIHGVSLPIASAEVVILSKLEWNKIPSLGAPTSRRSACGCGPGGESGSRLSSPMGRLARGGKESRGTLATSSIPVA